MTKVFFYFDDLQHLKVLKTFIVSASAIHNLVFVRVTQLLLYIWMPTQEDYGREMDKPAEIYNVDESGMPLHHHPPRVLTRKGQRKVHQVPKAKLP